MIKPLGLLLFYSLFGSPYSHGAAGKLGFVEGDVRLNRVQARDYVDVSVGDLLETRKGKCTILLAGNHVIHIGQDSRIKLTDFVMNQGQEKTTLDLAYGTTRALVRSQKSLKRAFNIRARAATMGVRGTEVYIESPRSLAKPQKFLTIDGVAELTFPQSRNAPGVQVAPQKVLLKQGQMIETSGGSADTTSSSKPQVQNIPKEIASEIAAATVPQSSEIRTTEQLAASPEVDVVTPAFSNGIATTPGFWDAVAPKPFDPILDKPATIAVDVRVTKQ